MNKLIVSSQDSGRTLVKYLQKHFEHLPVSRIERALREKTILINAAPVKDRKLILNAGDEISINHLDLEKTTTKITPTGTASQLKIIYEDPNILVLNKPDKVDMHLGNNSLDAQVISYLKIDASKGFTPSAVGQLDKITSGVIIYGKNYETLRELNNQQKHFTKIYDFKSDLPHSQEVTVKLAHDEALRREVVSESGKEATTKFYVTSAGKKAELVTGRKHQIRATLAYLGYPIYGDTKYGAKRLARVYLHASSLTLKNLSGELSYLNNKTFKATSG